MVRFLDSLQTTVLDFATFMASGGKLLHYHGESDSSIPAALSVHYWQCALDHVPRCIGSALTSLKELQEWYQFYLIPGAAHCGTNALQPSPYLQNNMDIMIDWV